MAKVTIEKTNEQRNQGNNISADAAISAPIEVTEAVSVQAVGAEENQENANTETTDNNETLDVKDGNAKIVNADTSVNPSAVTVNGTSLTPGATADITIDTSNGISLSLGNVSVASPATLTGIIPAATASFGNFGQFGIFQLQTPGAVSVNAAPATASIGGTESVDNGESENNGVTLEADESDGPVQIDGVVSLEPSVVDVGAVSVEAPNVLTGTYSVADTSASINLGATATISDFTFAVPSSFISVAPTVAAASTSVATTISDTVINNIGNGDGGGAIDFTPGGNGTTIGTINNNTSLNAADDGSADDPIEVQETDPIHTHTGEFDGVPFSFSDEGNFIAIADNDTYPDYLYSESSILGSPRSKVIYTFGGDNGDPTLILQTTKSPVEIYLDTTNTVGIVESDHNKVLVPYLNVNYVTGNNFDYLAEGEYAIDTFSYTILDTSTGESDTATVTIKVNGENDGPVAVDDVLSVGQGTVQISPSLTLNDFGGFSTNVVDVVNGAGKDIDPDTNDTLHIDSIDDTGIQGSVSIFDNYKVNSNGFLIIDPVTRGPIPNDSPTLIQYSANGKFNYLSEGETAQEQINYTVTDGNGGYDVGTLTVTINGDNDSPTDIQFFDVNDNTNEISSVTIDEGKEGIVVANLNTLDIDLNDTHVYSIGGIPNKNMGSGIIIGGSSSGTADDKFEIKNGQLKLKDGVSLDFEENDVYTVNVTSTDKNGNGLRVTESFTINVNDVAEAPGAQGTEFQVNTYTDHHQRHPSITGLDDGGFVAIWESYGQDGSIGGIFGQKYFANGSTNGEEFQVNTISQGHQFGSSITNLKNGGFVVTWTGSNGIYGKKFNADGSTNGDEFQVNTHTNSSKLDSSVTSFDDGGFLVTWSSNVQDGSGYGVFGQRFNPDGSANGGEFQINSYISNDQTYSSATSLEDGGSVVTWSSYEQDGSNLGIFAQRFNADGTASGDEFQVNTFTNGLQRFSDVEGLADGGFVVMWSSLVLGTNSSSGLHAQMYNADGTKNGEEFLASTFQNGHQHKVSLDSLDDGGFVATWSSVGQDGSSTGIQGQVFNADGTKMDEEFQANTYTESSQNEPSVASLKDGGFVITWQSWKQDGSLNGIFGQRFDADGNKVEILQDIPTINVINGTDGDDILEGTDGVDEINGLAGKDYIIGNDGGDILNGGGGRDTMFGGDGDDTINGDDGSDTRLDGGAGRDIINGGKGSDKIFGGDGDDIWLNGDDGHDYIYGEDGDDIIAGGAYKDQLFGGDGADTFVYEKLEDSFHNVDPVTKDRTHKRDTIHDFEKGLDMFDFSALTAIGINSFDDIKISQDPNDPTDPDDRADVTIIYHRGKETGDIFSVQVAGLHDLDENDFIFG